MKNQAIETKGATMITADRLVTINNYVPNPAEGKFHVMRSNDVTIFKPFDPSKPKTAARALYALGKIPNTPETQAFIATYGQRVILVSKQFLKLRKKLQLRLIEKVCFEAAGVPERFIGGMSEIEGTNLDRRIAAELQMMEKYGYRATRSLLNKEQKFNVKALKKAGKFLYKTAKKEKKLASKSTAAQAQVPEVVELRQPITFNTVEAAPVV